MAKRSSFKRIPQEQAEQVLTKVLRFRRTCDKYQRPDDVNGLLALFRRVSIKEGFTLDYVRHDDEMAGWIRPYARKYDASPEESLPPVIHLFDRDKIAGYRQTSELDELEVETLYQYLDYEKSDLGVFEYAFFVIELWSTKAYWHASEWLASTPIFTKRRFDSFLSKAKKPGKVIRPDHYGPLVHLEPEGGKVRFLVHCPVFWDRIYYLNCVVSRDGRVDHSGGKTVADLGGGFIF